MDKTKQTESRIKALEKPSKGVQGTNLYTAYFRSLSNIPNAAKVAELVGAEKAFSKERKGIGAVKNNIPYFEARYKAIDKLIELSGVKQVVEFGAGRSTRGLNNPEWNYVHTDQEAEALEQMRKIARKLMPGSKIPHFVKFDAISGEGMDKVMRYLRKERTAVVHEGMFRYYPNELKAKIATNARAILERYGGIYITPDIRTEDEIIRMRKIDPKYSESAKKMSKRIGRDLDSFVFESDQAAYNFFADLGFAFEINTLGHFVGELSCLKTLFPNPNLRKIAETQAKSRHIWKMVLRKGTK